VYGKQFMLIARITLLSVLRFKKGRQIKKSALIVSTVERQQLNNTTSNFMFE